MHKNLYSGIKVIDMTNNFAGPMASALLADYDAEVIHIEKPITGDDNRFVMPMVDGTSFSHMSSNRGKKSLVLDLKDPEAIAILKKMVADADILVESYRPGVMDRLGLGYETLKELNPRLIYCSISAYGQVGPYAKRPGYDVIAQAVSGIMYMTGDPDGSPTKIGTALGDWVGGLTAFGMIGTAMYYRSITGKGQHIDISLARLLMWMSARFDFTYTGKQDFRSGNHHTTLAPYGIFNGNNGESIIIGALNQNLWTKLCNVMGKPELADDPKFVTNDKRCENLPEVVAHIESWLKTFDHMADAEKLLMDAGVPCAKIYSHEDVYHDPHFNACGWITEIPAPDGIASVTGRIFPSNPFEFSEFKPNYRKAPNLGQDNHEILEDLGYSPEEVDSMEAGWAKKFQK